MLGQLAGTVAPLVRLPMTLAHGVEPLVEQLSSVASRALRLLDDVEHIPGRIERVLDTAEQLTTQISAVLTKADGLTKKVDGVVDDAAATLASLQPAVQALAALDAGTITRLVADLGLLTGGVRQLDPILLDDAIATVRAVPHLISTVESELLPALANLEGLVPVVAQLGVQVDNLDGTVVALLGGIPGAARLLKRGERPKPVQPSSSS